VCMRCVYAVPLKCTWGSLFCSLRAAQGGRKNKTPLIIFHARSQRPFFFSVSFSLLFCMRSHSFILRGVPLEEIFSFGHIAISLTTQTRCRLKNSLLPWRVYAVAKNVMCGLKNRLDALDAAARITRTIEVLMLVREGVFLLKVFAQFFRRVFC
jgi:hypothetical protein